MKKIKWVADGIWREETAEETLERSMAEIDKKIKNPVKTAQLFIALNGK